MNQLTIIIPEKQKQYPVFIGQDLLGKIPSLLNTDDYSTIVIITDEHIAKLYCKKLENALPQAKSIVLKSGEQEKTIETVQYIWE